MYIINMVISCIVVLVIHIKLRVYHISLYLFVHTLYVTKILSNIKV